MNLQKEKKRKKEKLNMISDNNLTIAFEKKQILNKVNVFAIIIAYE